MLDKNDRLLAIRQMLRSGNTALRANEELSWLGDVMTSIQRDSAVLCGCYTKTGGNKMEL
jgi:predicted DNA-binding transcriptional regulator YafY